jgi:hypothetical protein
MPSPKTSKDIKVYNGITQFCRYVIWDFAFIMAPFTKSS